MGVTVKGGERHAAAGLAWTRQASELSETAGDRISDSAEPVRLHPSPAVTAQAWPGRTTVVAADIHARPRR